LSTVWLPATLLGVLAVLLIVGWLHDRKTATRLRSLRRIYLLGEQLLAGRSAGENVRLLSISLPELMGLNEIHFYLPDRTGKELFRLEPSLKGSEKVAPELRDEPIRFFKETAELCYRNRSMITVSDAWHNPLFNPEQVRTTPRSAMFIPVIVQDEELGVLVVADKQRVRNFSPEECALLQHLANQFGLGMKLARTKVLREQAFGSERFDAFRYLLAATVGELGFQSASTAEARPSGQGTAVQDQGAGPAIVSPELAKTQSVINRLLRFINLPAEPAQLTDLSATVRKLTFAETQQGIPVRWQLLLPSEPLMVNAPAWLLEGLLLSLMRHAEAESANPTGRPAGTLKVLRLASIVQLHLSWTGPGLAFPAPTSSGATEIWSLSVCRAVVAWLGGQIRLSEDFHNRPQLEIELPLVPSETVLAAGLVPHKTSSAKRLTALVVAPDDERRRELITALADLGHRAVPATGIQQALGMINRVQFDVVFCTADVPDGSWLDCYEQGQSKVKFFVLVTRGPDPALSSVLPRDRASMLTLPLHPGEVSRVIEQVP